MWNTLYVFDIYVGAHLNGSTAWTTAYVVD
jgi:hypothetical protein